MIRDSEKMEGIRPEFPRRPCRGQGYLLKRGRYWWAKYFVFGVQVWESTKQEDREKARDWLNARIKEMNDETSLSALSKLWHRSIRLYVNLEEDEKLKFDILTKELITTARMMNTLLEGIIRGKQNQRKRPKDQGNVLGCGKRN